MLKALDLKHWFVLGHDVYMEKVETLCRRTLIRRQEYCSLTKEEWVKWATIDWKPIIQYVPTVSILANKWLIFVFIEETDATRILGNLWTIQKGSLVLNHWHSGLDPLT